MTRAEFITRLKNLPDLSTLTDAVLGAYLETALGVLAQYQPVVYRLVGVPANPDADGVYENVIPLEAIDVENVYRSKTDVEIEFDVVNVSGAGRQLHLKGVKLPPWIGITTYAGQIQDYNNFYDNYAGESFYASGLSFEDFDVVYTADPTIETLSKTMLTAVQKYIESESYRVRSSAEAQRSEIVDRDVTGASTTYRSGRNASVSYVALAKECMDEFKSIVRRPVLDVGRYGEIQKLWAPGEIS